VGSVPEGIPGGMFSSTRRLKGPTSKGVLRFLDQCQDDSQNLAMHLQTTYFIQRIARESIYEMEMQARGGI